MGKEHRQQPCSLGVSLSSHLCTVSDLSAVGCIQSKSLRSEGDVGVKKQLYCIYKKIVSLIFYCDFLLNFKYSGYTKWNKMLTHSFYLITGFSGDCMRWYNCDTLGARSGSSHTGKHSSHSHLISPHLTSLILSYLIWKADSGMGRPLSQICLQNLLQTLCTTLNNLLLRSYFLSQKPLPRGWHLVIM